MSGYNTRLAARMLDENATDTLEHDWQSAAGIDDDLRPESTEDRSLQNMSAALLEVQQRLNALEAPASSEAVQAWERQSIFHSLSLPSIMPPVVKQGYLPFKWNTARIRAQLWI